MSIQRKFDDIENLPPTATSRSGRLRDVVNSQWAGRDDLCLIRWSLSDGAWVMWVDPDPLTDNLQKWDDLENLPPTATSRSGRLRNGVNAQWAGRDDLCLIRWSPVEGGWVMWIDPDPVP